jgi:hypothetical protein
MGRKEPLDYPRDPDGICPACAERATQPTAESAPEVTTSPETWEEMLLEVKDVAQRIAERVEQALA